MIIQPEANTTKDIIHFARQAAATEGTTPPFPLSSPVPLINSFLIRKTGKEQRARKGRRKEERSGKREEVPDTMPPTLIPGSRRITLAPSLAAAAAAMTPLAVAQYTATSY